ncbi:imm11 family protein [Clostridium grantii]|uniref:Immunity MXAN-0049 protein domain-containing protein n=1 Tax=Clostridium grantii DSM 8605 TaxID=1121316 RepID=A0A1M5RQQ2_9CLOT|nr:DUF1629 domain-containing protein [Clostridium grantii]SHH28602.1 hypothetical protein SAMN02745207_00665 [Clostridium grantii DSM 8605]
MKYYEILFDYENHEDIIICSSNELYGFEQYDVESGIRIEKWDDRITFTYDPNEGNRATDFLCNDLDWFLVSNRFRNIMESNNIEGIQYLNITVENQLNQKKLKGYSVLNICNLLDALDLEHSIYDEFEIDENEKVIFVKQRTLKSEVIKGNDIFKLKGDNFVNFVSEKVKNLIENNGLTGFDFSEVKII